MSNLNKFALSGMLFISSILLANGMYSNQVFALNAEQNGNNHDQNGNLNEAEINANIEQENKCKKDTECENENEINNQLSITTLTQVQEQQPETATCETCFTDNLNESELNDLKAIFFGGDPTTLEQICQFIDENIQEEEFQFGLSEFLFFEFADKHPTVTEEDINNILDCLEEVFGVDIPRPPFP